MSMRIENESVVAAGPAEVFRLINDVERVAGCLPGAELLGREGEDGYRGRVSMRVGPIGASFEGLLRFLEVDEEARTMHLVGRGADVKGNGDAEADVRLRVVEHPDGAALQLTTDLNIRGKFVQFGKGAIATVSNKILKQFAANMAALLDQGDTAPDPVATAAGATEDSGAVTPTRTRADAPAPAGIPGVGDFLDAGTRKNVQLAAVFVAGCVQGWILTRAFGRRS